nr:hypothetical protein [Tanacetum cinerariifolium]
MMMYLKNVVGFKLDYFKGRSYDDIRLIFESKFNSNLDFLLKIKEQIEEDENRALQTINKTPAEKEAKRRKLNEEVKDHKRHLQIVPNEDDDVYTEATPLARKGLYAITCGLVRDVAEEAEAQVPAQSDDVQELAPEEVATDVVPPTPTSPSPSSPVISSSLPHQPPYPPQPQDAESLSLLFQQVFDTCSALVLRVEGLENDKAAQQLEIVKLKARVKKLEKINKDERIELVADQEKDVEVEGRHADKQVEIYNIDLDHSSMVLIMQEDDTEVAAASIPIPAAKPKTLTITAAPAVSTRRRTRVKDQIEMDAEYARKLQEEINKEHEEAYKNIDWNATLDHVQSKEPQYIKRYHGMKKKLQTESEACKNMIFYLKNVEGYKMDFFKGKKKRLEIVQDEDDDVFVEATPLAQKVPVMDYQIVVIDNKPKYKIIRADDTHQFYISFTTLLKNFDREDLETLWRILFLLVERTYPLSRFTLEQLVNVARLQVEEENEMSLELLRFTRQQLQDYQQG